MFVFSGTQEVGNLNKSKRVNAIPWVAYGVPRSVILFAPFPPDKLYIFFKSLCYSASLGDNKRCRSANAVQFREINM